MQNCPGKHCAGIRQSVHRSCSIRDRCVGRRANVGYPVGRVTPSCQATVENATSSVDLGLGSTDEVIPCPNIRHKLQARDSPFWASNNFGGGFVSDADCVALNSMKTGATSSAPSFRPLEDDPEKGDFRNLPNWALRAGARAKIYFDPQQVTAAIVTCGGLCPGLNDVVAGLVNKLTDYGVQNGKILGIKYGFRGFADPTNKPLLLTKRMVDGIQLQGGTILGTSRGNSNVKEIVKHIDMWGIDMLFVVGGNGGNAGANAIQVMCNENDINCCVIGVPKSIDNDILLIDRCFGFDTAVEEAQRALLAAKVEAESARRGVGLVKLMGRQSGFIACQASLASGVVDVCLIPEVPFKITGERGLGRFLEGLLKSKGHCVVCVAEGAGQDLVSGDVVGTDPSGNPILNDIGHFLKAELKRELPEADIKFIDPTYMIRAIPTNSNDRIYCKVLAHNAVHAAFAGYTGVTVGLVNTHYCYLPIPIVIATARTVNPKGKMWNRLRASIQQPNFV